MAWLVAASFVSSPRAAQDSALGEPIGGSTVVALLKNSVAVGTRGDTQIFAPVYFWRFADGNVLQVERFTYRHLTDATAQGDWRLDGNDLCLTTGELDDILRAFPKPSRSSGVDCYRAYKSGDRFFLVDRTGHLYAWFKLFPADALVSPSLPQWGGVTAGRRGESADTSDALWRKAQEAYQARETVIAEVRDMARTVIAAVRAELRDNAPMVAAAPPTPASAVPAEPPKPVVAAETEPAPPKQAAPAPAASPEPAATAEVEALRKELERANREKERAEAEARQLAAERARQEAAARNAPAADVVLPVIRVDAPARAMVGDRVRLRGQVGDDGSPPRLKLDGQPVTLFPPASGQPPIALYTLTFNVEVAADQPGTQQHVLEACDAAGNCIGKRVALAVEIANRPSMTARNYALIIGNNDYRGLPRLLTAVADARSVAELLESRYAFERTDVTLLLNAGRDATLDALAELRGRLGTDDRLLIYYAGHGQIDPVTEEGFWQPIDAVPDRDYTWIANSDVRRYLKGMPARHVLVIADSCFSGSLTRGVASNELIPQDRFFIEIDRPMSRKVISSGALGPVADAGSGGHSVFAYYFLKVLRENDEPYLPALELFTKMVRAVTNNSRQVPQYGTVSEAGDEGFGDFTFILRPPG